MRRRPINFVGEGSLDIDSGIQQLIGGRSGNWHAQHRALMAGLFRKLPACSIRGSLGSEKLDSGTLFHDIPIWRTQAFLGTIDDNSNGCLTEARILPSFYVTALESRFLAGCFDRRFILFLRSPECRTVWCQRPAFPIAYGVRVLCTLYVEAIPRNNSPIMYLRLSVVRTSWPRPRLLCASVICTFATNHKTSTQLLGEL